MNQSLNTPWYSYLSALPPNQNSLAYNRLQGIWANKTRFHGPEGSPKRIHELADPNHETHLTVSLWENFVLFEPQIWIPQLLQASAISLPSSEIKECKWSYEWQKTLTKGIKVMDVVISYLTADGNKHLIIIEAKNIGKKLGEKDRDPMYYLGIEDFDIFGPNRALIYCLDEPIIKKETPLIQACPFPTGFISWQQLAVLQFQAARAQFGNTPLAGFICGSILKQFTQLGIAPAELPFPYLSSEPNFESISKSSEKQPQSFYTNKFWELWVLV